jgi:hypothetical protein
MVLHGVTYTGILAIYSIDNKTNRAIVEGRDEKYGELGRDEKYGELDRDEKYGELSRDDKFSPL